MYNYSPLEECVDNMHIGPDLSAEGMQLPTSVMRPLQTTSCYAVQEESPNQEEYGIFNDAFSGLGWLILLSAIVSGIYCWIRPR